MSDELIHHRTLDPAMISINDHVNAALANEAFASEKISPLMLADSLEADSRTVMQFVEQVRTANGTLACERDDLETWSYLSRYFADKLRAGVALQTFRLTGQNRRNEKPFIY